MKKMLMVLVMFAFAGVTNASTWHPFFVKKRPITREEFIAAIEKEDKVILRVGSEVFVEVLASRALPVNNKKTLLEFLRSNEVTVGDCVGTTTVDRVDDNGKVDAGGLTRPCYPDEKQLFWKGKPFLSLGCGNPIKSDFSVQPTAQAPAPVVQVPAPQPQPSVAQAPVAPIAQAPAPAPQPPAAQPSVARAPAPQRQCREIDRPSAWGSAIGSAIGALAGSHVLKKNPGIGASVGALGGAYVGSKIGAEKEVICDGQPSRGGYYPPVGYSYYPPYYGGGGHISVPTVGVGEMGAPLAQWCATGPHGELGPCQWMRW